jgi:hypothetical protein
LVFLHNPEGTIIPGKIVISSSGTNETFIPDESIKLSSGPSQDSDILIVDPSKVEIRPLGEPENGYQKVSLTNGKDKVIEEAYLSR